MLRERFRKVAANDECGQIIILAAFTMVVVLGFAALAIDIGSLTHERRDLQNSADAMALAGGSQLTTSATGNTAADSLARTWATKNNVNSSEIESITFNQTCSGDNAPNIITVRLERTKGTLLAGVMGIDSMETAVCATARRFSSSGSIGMAPFGVEDDCVFGPDATPNTGDDLVDPGEMLTIKYDSQNDDGEPCGSNTGNFWTLAIDGSGAGENCGSPEPAATDERKLKEAICFGAITPLCTPAGVAEGEDCETNVDTQTGNQVGGISSSVQFLVNNVPDACDTMAEIVELVGTDYTLTDECNPFLSGYEGVSLVKMIPVLNGLFPDANGHSNVPIVNFLIVVIDPAQVTDSQWCKGNDCDLQAKLVEIGANPKAFRGTLNSDSSNNFTALID